MNEVAARKSAELDASEAARHTADPLSWRGWLSSGLSGNWKLIWRLVLLKAAYLLALIAAIAIWPDMDVKQFYDAYQRWPRTGLPIFASHFATWDTAHYLYLSEMGYSHGEKACAFYPLWPLIIRWFSPMVGGSYVITGLVLANLFSVAAWVLFHGLVKRRWGEETAKWSLAFLIAFPGSLFFQFNYTESLFLVLILLLWRGLEMRRLGWAWVAGGLLPLTRAIGLFAVLPIAWHLAREAVRIKGQSNMPSGQPRMGSGATKDQRWDFRRLRARMIRQPLWLIAAPLVGWGIYLLLMETWTHDPLEGFKAQKYWGAHSVGNLWNVPKFVTGLLSPTEWHEFKGSLLDRCSFVLLLYTLPALWRLDKGLLVWTYMLGILPAMSGTFASFTRFASCTFPIFIALGAFLGAPEQRFVRYVVLGGFALLQILLAWRFVNFRWAG